MKQSTLPPVLTRADFDNDEEFALYTSTEAGEWSSTGNLAAHKLSWQDAAIATVQTRHGLLSVLATWKASLKKLWRGYGYQPNVALVGQKYRQA